MRARITLKYHHEIVKLLVILLVIFICLFVCLFVCELFSDRLLQTNWNKTQNFRKNIIFVMSSLYTLFIHCDNVELNFLNHLGHWSLTGNLRKTVKDGDGNVVNISTIIVFDLFV